MRTGDQGHCPCCPSRGSRCALLSKVIEVSGTDTIAFGSFRPPRESKPRDRKPCTDQRRRARMNTNPTYAILAGIAALRAIDLVTTLKLERHSHADGVTIMFLANEGVVRRVASLLIRIACMRAKNRNATWGSVRVRVALVIRAAPERLTALYLDYRNWSRVFPATIRGVRWLETRDGAITVEVDHCTEGRVVNIIRPMSASVIALEEFKPRFDATFVNRFESAPEGTRYVLDAEIRFHMPYALVAPLLRGVVRNRMRRFVLEPMRCAAE